MEPGRHDYVGMFEAEQDPQTRRDEIARLTEESRRRAELPGDAPPAALPKDVAVSAKKIINTFTLGVVVFELLRDGLVGLAGAIFAPVCLLKWFSKPSEYGFLAGGLFACALAFIGLRNAWRLVRRIRA